jgi:hypothetical protein
MVLTFNDRCHFYHLTPGPHSLYIHPKTFGKYQTIKANNKTTKANTMASISDFFYRVSRDSKELVGLDEHTVRYILKFQEYGVDSGSTKACIDAADKYQVILDWASMSMSEYNPDEDEFYERRIHAMDCTFDYFTKIEKAIQEARDNEEMCEEDYFSDDGAISEDDDTEDDGEDDGELSFDFNELDIEDQWEEE